MKDQVDVQYLPSLSVAAANHPFALATAKRRYVLEGFGLSGSGESVTRENLFKS